MERPALNRSLDASTFRNHYYLKEELVRFCRASGLPVTGGKTELTERIACFLEGKPVERVKVTKVRTKLAGTLSEETLIESPFVCSEIHRAFFKAKTGSSFSFNVAFQKWLKSNAGKTYGDAIEAYARIRNEKKTKQTPIDSQFEYNTYIRAFFAGNPGRCLSEAIAGWKWKKSQAGSHRYDPADLMALNEEKGRPENGK